MYSTENKRLYTSAWSSCESLLQQCLTWFFEKGNRRNQKYDYYTFFRVCHCLNSENKSFFS